MYKKFTLKEISTIQNNFIPHLLDVIKREFKKESDRSIKSLLKKDLDFGKTGQEAFYFDRGNIIFKIYLEENGALHCYDEVDAIEIEVSSEERSRLDRLITNYAQHKRQTEQRSINDILQDEFSQGKFLETLGKPYLVYDIETSLINDDLEETEFYIGYYMEESQPGKTEYICITKETLPAFVDKMLNYEGYIIGFNHIYFDNPVCIYNVMPGTTPEEKEARQERIKKLNEKSLDLFVFVRNLTKKRIGLNRIVTDLVGMKKNLEGGGASVETLRKQRKTTGDDKFLKEIKSYCKNDVKMTAFLFFYLLYFKKISLNGEEFLYEVNKFLQLANNQEIKAEEKTSKAQSLRD